MVRVLLVGLMGSGKSTVGQAVATLTGWPCLDNDAMLERSTGHTAAELERAEGVGRLRSAESDVLTLTLAMPPPLVAGVAAGVVLDRRDRERMHQHGFVVWLRPSVRTLVRRLSASEDGHRPRVSGDASEVLERMADEREPLYTEVAHLTLDMDVLTPADAARAVVAALPAELPG